MDFCKCLKCNHRWFPRTFKNPKCCPKCRSQYWNGYRDKDKNMFLYEVRWDSCSCNYAVVAGNTKKEALENFENGFFEGNEIDTESGGDFIADEITSIKKIKE